MQKPYYKPITNAFPDITLPEPYLSKSTLLLVKFLNRIYLRFVSGITHFELKQSDRLFDSFKRTLSGKTSTILAFRHPYGDEPQILGLFAVCRLTKIAKKSGVHFPIKAHISFVHGYEVPRWSDSFVRWLLPRIKAMPVYHAKMDSVSMNRIARAIEDGPYPVGIAPEGQVTYNSEIIPRLEQGVIRIGFQCAANLDKRESKKNVEILPVSVHFRFDHRAKAKLEKLLHKIEDTVFPIHADSHVKQSEASSIFQRFEMIRNHLIAMNEKFYKIPLDTERTYEDRIDAIMKEAIVAVENILRVDHSDGDLIPHLYYLRQIYWDRIYLPGKEKKDLQSLSLVERALTDRLAGEAWYAGRHIELVDFIYFFRNPIPTEDAPFHLIIEYAQNLWDFTSRTMGGNFTHRMNINPKKVIICTGEPLDLSKKLSSYRESRKETIAQTLHELESKYMTCIEEVKKDDNP